MFGPLGKKTLEGIEALDVNGMRKKWFDCILRGAFHVLFIFRDKLKLYF